MSRARKASSISAAGRSSNKSVEQLRQEVVTLEGILDERKLQFVDLVDRCEAELDRLGGQEGRGEAADEEEALKEQNRLLKRQLQALTLAEKEHAKDPRVQDKMNEVRAVRMDIKTVEKEIETLQAVKKRRDRGLKQIDETDAAARRVRVQQSEQNNEVRAEIKTLQEALRVAQKESIEAHERFADLQAQLKLGVTEEDVSQLKRDIQAQEEQLESLKSREKELKKRQEVARDDGAKTVAKERRDMAKLAQEVEDLHVLLLARDAEMKKSYQTAGRAPPANSYVT